MCPLSSSPPPKNHYYNLVFKVFRQTAFTERETFASLENEPCRWWWWRWRSILLLKKSLRGFYSRLENKHCSWWRPRRAFQLFKTYVFLSRLRLVRSKHAGLQCAPFANGSAGVLKRSVPSTLRSRRTALPICQRRWCKTGQLQRVPSEESGLQCVLFANASAGSGLISSSPPPPPPENHYCYNLAFKAFRQTAFTERETFASLENEPCRCWWWRWRSAVLLLKKSLRVFYSSLENKHCS